MIGFFITGTNTDAGKTVCTAALLRALRGRGLDAVAAKPVQTGIRRDDDGQPVAPDMQIYRAATGWTPEPEELPLAFQQGFTTACSPHLAAELEGGVIDAQEIARKLRQFGERHAWLLVEGAGGLLVPLNRQETMLDLARLTGLPVVLVADNILGMINHTLLTLAVLRQHGLTVAGVVVNHTSPDTLENLPLRADNIRTVREFGKVRILATLPHLPSFSPASQADWQTLANAMRSWADTL